MSTETLNPSLECIEGKDDFLVIPIPLHNRLIIGYDSNGGQAHPIKELYPDQGTLVFQWDGARLIMEPLTVLELKVNGKKITNRVEIHSSDVIRLGDSIWRVNFPAKEPLSLDEKLFKPDSLHRFTGLGKLENFKITEIFSEVFRRKSSQDMEDQLLTGTSRHRPDLMDFDIRWAKPWLFSRFLTVTILLGIVMYIAFKWFNNPLMLPGVLFIGTFAMPLSVLIFFMEMNTPRNISIFNIISAVFAGGVLSLVVTLIFFDRFAILSTILGASSAGIIEEIAKILVVIVIFGKNKSFRWAQNGMLLGAAIGCGFAAFESAGYAFVQLFQQENGLASFTSNIILRGSHAPFTHIIWTANAAAALWYVKAERAFSPSMLFDKFFIRIFISSMLLHMVWNAPFLLFRIPVFLDLKFMILGIIGLSISMRLIQKGLKQIQDARQQEIDRLAAS
jgi:RsiW-degrading membrane proteinase PrsW (M82 family)